MVSEKDIYDPLGFRNPFEEEQFPSRFEDYYNRDCLIFIPLTPQDPMSHPTMICQYKENKITINTISEMAKLKMPINGYFSIYGRYFGPSDWIFEHIGDGKLRKCMTSYPEQGLGHIVIMREFNINKLDIYYRKQLRG